MSLRRSTTSSSLVRGVAREDVSRILNRRKDRGASSFKFRKQAPKPTATDVEWMPLFGESEAAQANKVPSWQEIRNMNARRTKLLDLARETSPIDTVLAVRLLGRTVFPRLIRHPLIWVVWGGFALTATLSRFGFGGDPQMAEEVLDGSTTVVAFMIIFFVGYCYTRYNEQFNDVQQIMHSIVNACSAARATFYDPDEVHRLWRYLNLMHASAYCGLTDYLTKENFFMPLCEVHNLLGEGDVRREEMEALDKVGLDQSGGRASSMYEVWCLEILRQESMRAGPEKFATPIYARLHGEVESVGNHIQRLFAYRFQVLPFICAFRPAPTPLTFGFSLRICLASLSPPHLQP